MEKILVSACLLGSPVRYNGSDRLVDNPLIARWREQGRIVPLCPEVAAGFPTPRPPAEIEPGRLGDDVLGGSGRILDDTGADVTECRKRHCSVFRTRDRTPCRGARRSRLRASLRRLAHKSPPAGQHGNAVPDVTGRPAL
jgi:uncharacterized protein YbbK (DUF523 family)